MKIKIIKRIFSTFLCILLIIITFSYGLVIVSAESSYDTDYRKWSQGASSFPALRPYGCWVVAQSKLIYEVGINNSASFNPDVYYCWQNVLFLIPLPNRLPAPPFHPCKRWCLPSSHDEASCF